jgi:hypothetical protein
MDAKLTEKIRQLLAMAEHANSNENEAAIAMRKAQELLLKNNLTRADIQDSSGEPAAPAGIGKLDISEAVGFSWKRYLLHTLAINNLCQTVGSPATNTMHVFGTYENVKGVLEMYNWLTPELERIALRAWSSYKADGTGRENARTWKHGFFMGAIKAIHDKLKESMQEFAAGPGHAVVPYNEALVKDAVKRVFPYLTKSHSSTRSADGMAAGRAAGRSINLRPQRKLSGTLALR